ncbi:MAG TPA: ATP-binding protein [Bryobacteraceae bacterium]|nr:ATP-binding protein [Bryobacteraceae bacterium]
MRTRHPLLPYAEAVFAVVVATLLRLGLVPLVGTAVPFVTYFAASLILAWYRGFGPAAVCVLLSIYAGSHYILRHGESTLSPWGRTEQAAVLGFAISSLIVCFLIDFQHRTLARARSAEKAQAAIARENVRLLEQAQVAQEELRRANSDLTRANNELEVFAYSASHDLKEPLRTITTFAELLQSRMARQSLAENSALLETILGAARRMNTLIEDLLLYRNAGKPEESPPPGIDAASVVAEVTEGLTGQINSAGATVSVDGALPTVAIHRSTLAQLFQNLISNSIKYRTEAAPCIRVSAQAERGWCVFSVTDNGLGISEEYKEQIFAPFQRLHGSDYPGNGIGLAICQRLVQQYGGRVWLEKSALGRGSTFCFTAPLANGQKD